MLKYNKVTPAQSIRGVILLSAVFVLLTVFSAGAFCYDINGTATGNLLNGGYAAEGDGFSVSADAGNGFAVEVTADGKVVTADAGGGRWLNVCGGSIYYIATDFGAETASLLCYDTDSRERQVLYSVPLDAGMKNLIVDGDRALFIGESGVTAYDLVTGEVSVIIGGTVRDFIPVKGGFVYGLDGCAELYFYNEKQVSRLTLAENALYYDVDENGTVYFSDGDSGLYSTDLRAADAVKLGEGGSNIVCSGGEVYWKSGEEFVSLGSGKTAAKTLGSEEETLSTFSVVGGEVEVSGEENLGYALSGTLTPSAVAYRPGLPGGDYKEWKQWDSRWSSAPLGGSTLGRSGCLVTSMAILLVGSGCKKAEYLKGDFDPGIFANLLNKNGFFSGGGAINSYDFIRSGGFIGKLGFTLYADTRQGSPLKWPSSKSEQVYKLATWLDNGFYVIVCVYNPSTGNTHWVAVDRVVGDDVYICDPGYTSKQGILHKDYDSVNRALVFKYSGTHWIDDGSYVTGISSPIISTKELGDGTKEISIKCATQGAQIYYTLDGSVPTAKSKQYTGAFKLGSSTTQKTVKAIAVSPTGMSSSVVSYNVLSWNNPYKDLRSSKWYYDEMAQAVELGILVGTSKTNLSPENKISRSEFATVLYRLVDFGEDSHEDDFQCDFSDINDNAWYYPYVSWAKESEIVAGTSKTTFSPYSNITREQICVMLHNFAVRSGADIGYVRASGTFTDSKNISDWARSSVNWAYRTGIMAGVKNGSKLSINPKGNATRAEAAALVLRMLKKI